MIERRHPLRGAGMCLLAAALGWVEFALTATGAIPYYSATLHEAGWSTASIRLVLIAQDVLLGPVPYIVGCWLLWWVARSKASRLTWLPVAAGGTRLVVACVSLVALFLIPYAVRGTVLEAVGYYHLGGEVLLVAVAVTIALEPFVSIPLSKLDTWRVTGFTVLATLWTLFGWVIDVLYYPVHLVALSAYSLSTALGFRSDAVTTVAQVVAVAGWWLVVARTFVNWRRQRRAAAMEFELPADSARAAT